MVPQQQNAKNKKEGKEFMKKLFDATARMNEIKKRKLTVARRLQFLKEKMAEVPEERKDVGLYVNLYINTFAHIVTPRGQDYMVDIITSMPWEGMTKLRLRSPGKHTVEATLRLRIPEWQETPLPIYVNGIEYDYNIQRGYAIITRSWQADDEVYIPFNVVPRRVVENGRTMWRGGPIVYCLNDSLQCNARADIQYCGEDPETRHPIYALSSTTPGDTTKHVLRPYFDLPPEKRNIWQSNQSR